MRQVFKQEEGRRDGRMYTDAGNGNTRWPKLASSVKKKKKKKNGSSKKKKKKNSKKKKPTW